jgi:hypothetical protein
MVGCFESSVVDKYLSPSQCWRYPTRRWDRQVRENELYLAISRYERDAQKNGSNSCNSHGTENVGNGGEMRELCGTWAQGLPKSSAPKIPEFGEMPHAICFVTTEVTLRIQGITEGIVRKLCLFPVFPS